MLAIRLKAIGMLSLLQLEIIFNAKEFVDEDFVYE